MTPRPRKRFAQHWLRSEKALQQIVSAAELSGGPAPIHPDPSHGESPTGDVVLEIGPGTGVLTHRLLHLARAVIAVEIDRDLCRLLRKDLGTSPNFHLIEADCLTLDLEAALATAPAFPFPNKVVANIPYNITGPILEKLLGTIQQPNLRPFETLVLLVQKEVAQRLCAKPGHKAFGALSVRVQYLAACEWICEVPARAFQPPPKVDSAVIRLRPRPFSQAAESTQHLETLIKVGFANRRKMLRNNLKGLFPDTQPADSEASAPFADLFQSLNLNPQARAEDLGVADWVALSNVLLHLPQDSQRENGMMGGLKECMD